MGLEIRIVFSLGVSYDEPGHRPHGADSKKAKAPGNQGLLSLPLLKPISFSIQISSADQDQRI
jgi:hypothetical protein